MEGTERQLRTRLADGLRRDDTDGFAQIHHLHGGQIAAVAHAAQAALRFTGEHGTDLDRFDARIFNDLRRLFRDQRARFRQHARTSGLVAFHGIEDVLGRHVADETLGQGLDHVFAFLQRGRVEAEDRAAILFLDRHVLRHVDQSTREVTGVGRLECRVGQTLTGSVRRREVLEHRQPFTEVRLDRVFDDFADTTRELLLRLGHEAAHACQLTDLVARATRARVEHHEHGIEAALRFAHGLDHGVSDVGVRVRPRIDDLIVALTVRDVARGVGALEALHALRRFLEQRFLFLRDVQVFDADGDTAARGVAETELLQAIEQRHRFREAGIPVALEDEFAEGLLLHVLVQERQPLRHDRVEQHAAGGRRDPRHAAVRLVEPADRRLVRGAAVRDREFHFRDGRHRRELGDRHRVLHRDVIEARGRLRGHVATQHDVL